MSGNNVIVQLPGPNGISGNEASIYYFSPSHRMSQRFLGEIALFHDGKMISPDPIPFFDVEDLNEHLERLKRESAMGKIY
jgi:hypothetical protein